MAMSKVVLLLAVVVTASAMSLFERMEEFDKRAGCYGAMPSDYKDCICVNSVWTGCIRKKQKRVVEIAAEPEDMQKRGCGTNPSKDNPLWESCICNEAGTSWNCIHKP